MIATRLAWLLAIAAVVALAAPIAQAQPAPAEIRIGISTITSGPGAVFGVPAKAAAELWIADLNAAGGIRGTKIAPVFIDESPGRDTFLSEYRRVVREQGATVMLAAISSDNCNLIAPVAEELRVVDVLWGCGSEKILEDRKYGYVFRTASNAVTEMVAAAIHLLRVKPGFSTIAVVNQDYSWGRDSWEIFRNALLAMKPDAKIVAELFPKLGTADFSGEIARLDALKPDVVLSTAWGGDLDALVRQAGARGLFRSSQFVLPVAESSLERLGKDFPEGVLVGMRGDVYFADPEFAGDAKRRAFVQKFRARTGAYPIYPVAHVVQALQAVVDAHELAIAANAGRWPSSEQVAAALRTLEFKGQSRPIRMRADGQALQGQLYGVTKTTPAARFPLIDQLTLIPADLVTTPAGQKSPEWVRTLKPDLVKSERIRSIGAPVFSGSD